MPSQEQMDALLQRIAELEQELAEVKEAHASVTQAHATLVEAARKADLPWGEFNPG